ncbi:lung adenoma susceptibility protein 2 isoform X2 [Onychostoma macrolepis]|uniref:lung adenoma susceptibility protein 2 isoform X2 n=1 Tax=Onychostoma macrolepis TaxID=369639 RepID=UPI00272A0E4E|nr:lung adenoma susceptibility protein 2 isoform X2 [Onychostoma macrolepis]
MMASEEGLMSPESSVTSLLATLGVLQSSLHPEPVPIIKYRDRHYISASEALDAYITDFQRSLRDAETTTGKLELPEEITKPHPRNRDVLKTSLTDEELIFLNVPVRNRDSDRLSMTTDDLLALPNDGSLPVTRTSALLSRSGSFPLGLSFNSSSRSHSRPIMVHKRRPVPAASRKSLPVDDLLRDSLRSHRQAPPPNIPPANRTRPPDLPRSSHLPRWMTSQKSEMDFSGMTSVPELKYPVWLRQCEESSDGQQSDRPLPPRVPSWVGDLEESGGEPQSDARGQRGVKGHAGELYGSQSIGQCSLRDLRLQFEQKLQAAKRGPIHEGPFFKDGKIGSLIFEQMLNSPSFALCEPVKKHNSSGDTEDALDADRSWDNPPVTFKSPVPVGGADEPPAPEELQRSKSAASCSSGYSSRKHPGPVETLKHMLFRLQAVEHDISQSHASGDSKTTSSAASQLERDTPQPVPQQETEETELGNVESLQRALHHLDRLKTLVEDMNERKARAEDDGTDCTDTPAANITDWARINKRL